MEQLINEYFKGWETCPDYGQALNRDGECVSVDEIKDMARYFYKKGESKMVDKAVRVLDNGVNLGRRLVYGPSAPQLDLEKFRRMLCDGEDCDSQDLAPTGIEQNAIAYAIGVLSAHNETKCSSMLYNYLNRIGAFNGERDGSV